MNVFYLDHNTAFAAKALVDKHIVKMPLETVQLLSTAHRILDGQEITITHNGRNKKRYVLSCEKRNEMLYQASHINHPSAVWCRQNRSNYRWLAHYLIDMCFEYHARYGRHFKFFENGLVDELLNFPENLPEGEFTQPPPAMPEHYKVQGDAIESYRRYYAGDKWRFAKWKHNTIPSWLFTSMKKAWRDNALTDRSIIVENAANKKNPPMDTRVLTFAKELICELAT